jgi:hypothetical protein
MREGRDTLAHREPHQFRRKDESTLNIGSRVLVQANRILPKQSVGAVSATDQFNRPPRGRLP